MIDRSRAAVIADVRTRVPELSHALLAGVQQEIPAYRDLTGRQLDDIRMITAWVIERLLHAWAEPRGLDEQDQARFRAIGAARAKDGRPIAAVLRAYRVAAIGLAEAVRVIGGDRLDLEDLGDLTTVMLTGLDELSEALLVGHTTALAELSGNQDRARRELLDDLLSARQTSLAAAQERAQRLGADVTRLPVLAVVESADPQLSIWAPGIDSLLADVSPAGAPGTAEGGVRHLHTLRGRRVVLLLPAGAHLRLDSALRDRRWRGCALAAVTLAHLPGSFRLVHDALDAAPPVAFEGRPLLDAGDAHLLALLTAKPSADPKAVIATVLGPLAEPANSHILEGLSAYLAAGSATAAATRLRLHPQTLRYRLRRARELTGRDPHRAWHRLALQVATQVHQIDAR